MTQRLDTFIEQLVLEGRMLWAFIQGHIVMMAIPSLLWFQTIQEHNIAVQRNDFSPFLVGALIGVFWAVVCWAVMRFRFPYASARFINFTRIAFHVVLITVISVILWIPNLTRLDPPGYTSNKEILFLAASVVMTVLTLSTCNVIMQTTKTYLALLDTV